MAHATQIADAAKVMLALNPSNATEQELILAAAWLCTIAGAQNYPIGSTELAAGSADMAAVLLASTERDTTEIEVVKQLIKSTGTSTPPANTAEAILRDACTHYYAAPNFREAMKKLYKTELRLGITQLDYIMWRQALIATLEQHQYHTAYGLVVLTPQKEAHLISISDKVERKMAALGEAGTATTKPEGTSNAHEATLPVPLANDADFPPKSSRTIETMFRISAPNNVRVSAMADDKAQIMINVNAIILSLAFGLIIKSLETHPGFAIPTAILLLVNVSTIVFAVLATRPKLADGKFTQEQIDDKSVNLMFFGSFYNMSYEDYAKAVQKMLGDTTFLYNSLTKDIYWQGKVLGRKFKLLRISYTIFMYGIVVAALAFGVGVYVEFFAK
ncbi:MAG: hypothetical protein EAY75_08465 [Bacteroidetes bacterium]|nr:MAG: hypothetical protein EAY75_08465 [Bacteroidota bacterium]